MKRGKGRFTPRERLTSSGKMVGKAYGNGNGEKEREKKIKKSSLVLS